LGVFKSLSAVTLNSLPFPLDLLLLMLRLLYWFVLYKLDLMTILFLLDYLALTYSLDSFTLLSKTIFYFTLTAIIWFANVFWAYTNGDAYLSL